jgi:hypothetical protein
MRLTPEQFQWRKENRIDGSYVSKPPEAYKGRRKNSTGPVKPKCENCGRETEYLFPGFIYPEVAEARATTRVTKHRGTVLDDRLVRALSSPFQTEAAEVCMRCRPPSNLEIQEMLDERKDR